MSLARLVYYGAVIGGWAAFVGWLVSALSPLDPEGRLSLVLICGLVGAAIGAGLNMVAGMANGQWKQQLKRVAPGLIGGFVGGAVGSFIGDVLYRIGLPRAIGWAIMGAAIGVVEGLYDRSSAKLRNGLIGGSIGGLLGGLLFNPITSLLASNTGMTSRATAFVILGACIGILIGFVQVVLKEAWLTVLDGYRPGRQLILSEGVTVLGKAEYAALPFVGKSDNDLDWEHCRIVRRSGGTFAVEDNNSKLGVMVNGTRIQGTAPLKDGDILKIGSNMIRFSERKAGKKAATDSPAPKPTQPTPARTTSPTPQAQAPVASPRPSATSQFDPPAPRPAAKPLSPTATIDPPAIKPAPKPAPTVAPAAAPPGTTACPKCGRAVSKGQRYCIACDLHF